jgi:hypothetical protein
MKTIYQEENETVAQEKKDAIAERLISFSK